MGRTKAGSKPPTSSLCYGDVGWNESVIGRTWMRRGFVWHSHAHGFSEGHPPWHLLSRFTNDAIFTTFTHFFVFMDIYLQI